MKSDQKSFSEYTNIKNQLLNIDLAIPGTIHALYALCGSAKCECAKDKSKRHGPYYRWHYLAGKHKVSLGINESDLHQFETWIKNREALEQIVKQLLDIGVAQAKKHISLKKQSAKKLKNVSSSKRGK